MFQEFKQLHENYLTKRDPTFKYQIIDILKRIQYFSAQVSIYSTEVLFLYLPMIDPFIIREGMSMINSVDHFVILQGLIRVDFKGEKEQKKRREPSEVLSDGMMVDCSNPNLERITVLKDSFMIKIDRASGIMKKYANNLQKFQKDRLCKYRQMQKMISLRKDITQNLQKIKQGELFRCLGNHDLFEVLLSSKIVLKSKRGKTHDFGQFVHDIIYIVQGTVKVSHIHKLKKSINDHFTQKYMIHKKKEKSSVTSFVEKREFIGLQEHLNDQGYKSYGEIVSHQSVLLVIPVDIFDKKFNEATNYRSYKKLKQFIENKKELIERTMQSKEKKEEQIEFEQEKKKILQKYSKKSETIGNQINLAKVPKESRKNMMSKRKSATFYPQECYMPQRLAHKVKVYEEKYSSLPKIDQKITLFPQEYAKAYVPIDLKEKMRIAEAEVHSRNPEKDLAKSSRRNSKINFISPQSIREKFLFQNLKVQSQLYSKDKLDSPETNPEQFIKTSRNRSIDMSPRLVFGQTKYHHNRSIYNNFKANKSKSSKLVEQLQKTLQIG